MSKGAEQSDKMVKTAVKTMLADDDIAMGDLYLAMAKATFRLSIAIAEDIEEVTPLILDQGRVRLVLTFGN